jgi:hypothetical protein
MSGAISYHYFIVFSSSMLVPSYLHHGTLRGVQSMGPIYIPRVLNIEQREIRGKPLPQTNHIIVPRNLGILRYLRWECRGIFYLLLRFFHIALGGFIQGFSYSSPILMAHKAFQGYQRKLLCPLFES